jgi:hypothetical protein
MIIDTQHYKLPCARDSALDMPGDMHAALAVGSPSVRSLFVIVQLIRASYLRLNDGGGGRLLAQEQLDRHI